ncbi:protein of unknown function (plasmid) [Cupriavidus neocaledonicus]|uniref:Uncharacterized protein n=1 Tax=Cupriavidus neocaledonicus TaxID=1040979 RepID=A0A375HP93_9BURK|nr:hypothetical protein CBM2605_B130443 [Cupriavidus neocaledonicus]SPD59183.1 protein of unknown function [Cupriavidus neocaledonicus]
MDTDPTFGVFFMAKYDEKFKRRVVERYLTVTTTVSGPN